MTERVDVLIVGAGLSGIGAAAHLRRRHPAKTFALVEARGSAGGTWDLFRYPGVRSDSDMFTLGYVFRPWTGAKAIADGASIREYLLATIAEEGLDAHIRLHTRVTGAAWSSESATWTVATVRDGEESTIVCSFLWVCAGYYRYDEGFRPVIDGMETFDGAVVHPQHWPADLAHAAKRIVVVGSGSGAVTLVPALARTAAHVTMVQRSPSYIAAVQSTDRIADLARRALRPRLAYSAIRVKNIASSMATYQLSRRAPRLMKAILRRRAAAALPAGFDVDRHLTPRYEPWDQRVCAAPDGDLFDAISRGAADIVTDRIARVTPSGVLLVSGTEIAADVLVLATGLNLLALGGIAFVVDDRPVDVPSTLAYRGMMLNGVPNLAFTMGYTNASWTLRADLVAASLMRTFEYMDRRGLHTVTPVASAAAVAGPHVPLLDLQSGYVLRGGRLLPRQGTRSPWRIHQNYVHDFLMLRLRRGTHDLRFGRAGAMPRSAYERAPSASGSAAPTPSE